MNYSFGPMTFTQNGGPVQSPLIQTALFPNNDHDLAFNSGVYAQKSANSSTGFNTEWKVNNDLKVDLDVHHSTSKTDPDSPYGSWAQIDLAMFTMGTTTAYYDKKLPILNLGTTKFQKERMQFTGSQFDNQLADQSVDQWQTKATYKLSAEDKLIAGLGFTKMKDRRGGYNHTNADWGGLGVQGDAASTVKVNSTSLGGMFSQVDGHNDSRLHPTFWYVDFNEAREQAIKVLMTSGVGGSAPYTRAQAEAYFAASPDYTRGQDFRTTEKSTSAYGQWDHAFDTELPSNISVGLRYESTKIDSASQVVPRVAAAWIAQNEVNLTAGEPAFGSAQGSYKFWLPNIDYDVDLASNLKLRASYGHNIGRPNFGVLVGGVTVGDNANAGGGNGNTGNPNLKPLLSKNLDASLEYYYAKSSYVAAGLFYKKVTNFIGNTVVVRTFPGINNPRAGAYAKQGEAACGANAQPLCIRNWIFTNLKGQPGVIVGTTNASGEISGRIEAQPGDPLLNFNISTPTNIKGDNIRGLELNAQHLFGNSGFGVSGNLTIVKTGLKFKLDETGEQAPLVGVGNSANLVGFYEDSAWSVRAAYNWRGKFLARSTDGAGNNPVFTAAYGQLDVGIGYKIGKNLTLQADLINLNDGYIRQFARTEEQVEGVYQTGRRFMVGARYRF
jgi:TonB-dependent receptor